MSITVKEIYLFDVYAPKDEDMNTKAIYIETLEETHYHIGRYDIRKIKEGQYDNGRVFRNVSSGKWYLFTGETKPVDLYEEQRRSDIMHFAYRLRQGCCERVDCLNSVTEEEPFNIDEEHKSYRLRECPLNTASEGCIADSKILEEMELRNITHRDLMEYMVG